ncbi:MAG: hypothetical protein BM564_01125 [Bacteroidetes bacterium MedPE-SWsnd-G2]|nr:MAG: hypothetical protein BM564_01125 [Bacteroidetes bacterium MedPE-SWsnd-G2]
MTKIIQKTDSLAIERTKLANQRTILAFVRTFIGFLGGGISAITMSVFSNYRWLGYVFIIAAIITLVFGIINYLRSKRAINRIKNND